MFTFKQFSVADELCAMKVGTDGTLLGAWCPLPEAEEAKVLDIGTGSGLIALMLAQRLPWAAITAIDIDQDAARQAAINFEASPWSDRLEARCVALQELERTERYDLIVSNPPYFVDSLKNPDRGRQTARHTDTLPFSTLIAEAASRLDDNGTLALILPAEAEETIVRLAAASGLAPYRTTRVHTRSTKPAKRVMLAMRRTAFCGEPLEDRLILMDDNGQPRSEQYQTLCREFYL